jgi:hypothetical protein
MLLYFFNSDWAKSGDEVPHYGESFAISELAPVYVGAILRRF